MGQIPDFKWDKSPKVPEPEPGLEENTEKNTKKVKTSRKTRKTSIK